MSVRDAELRSRRSRRVDLAPIFGTPPFPAREVAVGICCLQYISAETLTNSSSASCRFAST